MRNSLNSETFGCYKKILFVHILHEISTRQLLYLSPSLK